HRLRHRLERLHVDHHPRLAFSRGWIGMLLTDDLDNADDRLALVGMIEEAAVALLHLYQVLLGGVVAHAGPLGALGAGLDLLVPGPRTGFALHQPVSHWFLILPIEAGAPVTIQSPHPRSASPPAWQRPQMRSAYPPCAGAPSPATP